MHGRVASPGMTLVADRLQNGVAVVSCTLMTLEQNLLLNTMKTVLKQGTYERDLANLD